MVNNRKSARSILIRLLVIIATAVILSAIYYVALNYIWTDDPPVIGQEEIKDDPSAQDTEFVKSRRLDELPTAVQEEYLRYCQDGWKGLRPGSSSGTHAGGTYQNRNQVLPAFNSQGEELHFKEYDVYDKKPGQNRGAERFVVSFNPDNSICDVYYTSDHYDTFIRIIDDDRQKPD